MLRSALAWEDEQGSRSRWAYAGESAQELAGALIDLVTTLGLIGVAVGRTRARGPIV